MQAMEGRGQPSGIQSAVGLGIRGRQACTVSALTQQPIGLHVLGGEAVSVGLESGH